MPKISPIQRQTNQRGVQRIEQTHQQNLRLTKAITPKHTPKKIEKLVKKNLCDILGVTEEMATSDATLLQNLGADSLDVIELVMALEEEFGINIKNEDAYKAETVEDICKLVERLTK